MKVAATHENAPSLRDVPVVRVAPIAPWDAAPPGDVPAVPWSVAVEIVVPGQEMPGRASREDDCYRWAPLDPGERRRLYEDAGLPPLMRRSVRRAPIMRWPLETHWYQCLQYPLVAWKPILGFAPMLAFATCWLSIAATETSGLMFITAAFLPLVMLSFGFSLLYCVLNSAAAGEVPRIYWPGLSHIHIALLDFGRWLFCFAAGPVVVLWIAAQYWVHCGPVGFLDAVILVELMALAVGYCLFSLLTITCTGRWIDANPLRVAQSVRHLGYRAGIAIAAAAALAIVHGSYLGWLIEVNNRTSFGAWFLLTAWWISALTCGAILLRMVGLWSYQAHLSDALRSREEEPIPVVVLPGVSI